MQDQFLAYLPNAKFVEWILEYIDNDGQLDFIATFDYEEKDPKTSSSIGVICADGTRSAVNVASSDAAEYVFTLKPNLSIEGSVARFSLQNVNTPQILEYSVDFQKQEMGFNTIISSEELS